jgi:hypothetical protein
MPTVKELRDLARANGVKGYYKMNKTELLAATGQPAQVKVPRRVKMLKKDCLANPYRYRWLVGKGCFELDKQNLEVILHMGFKYDPEPNTLPQPPKAYIDDHISKCADAIKDNMEGPIEPVSDVEYIGNRTFKFTCLARSAEYVANELLNQPYDDGPYEGMPWPGTFVVPPPSSVADINRSGRISPERQHNIVGYLYYTKAVINGKTFLPRRVA